MNLFSPPSTARKAHTTIPSLCLPGALKDQIPFNHLPLEVPEKTEIVHLEQLLRRQRATHTREVIDSLMAACQGNGHEPGGIRNSLCHYSSERRLASVTRVAQSNAELKEHVRAARTAADDAHLAASARLEGPTRLGELEAGARASRELGIYRAARLRKVLSLWRVPITTKLSERDRASDVRFCYPACPRGRKDACA